mmetsp:Transcript_1566/g.2040  ORF Transcript_1566/g.2040 Transcript_1566/m.2040 type:complete len:94 (+) Transcript_1566:609-890(+)
MMTYNLSVVLGIHPKTIYYIIKPPEREYDPIPPTAQKLKEVLKQHGVHSSNAKILELRNRVIHLQTKGKVGLLRAQRRKGGKGGPKKPFRATI